MIDIPSKISILTRLAARPTTLVRHMKQYVRQSRYEAILGAVYDKYAEYTMITRHSYLNNLRLIETCCNVSGSVVECGVWRGGMIAGAAEILGADRRYILFDSFEGLPPVQDIDGLAARNWQANTTSPHYHDNCTSPRDVAEMAMNLTGAKYVDIHQGWFNETLANYESPDPISVLRLDGDWYDSTMTCLEALFPYVSPGGVVIIDDYYAWDGCRRAIHDYLSRTKSNAAIDRFRDDVAFIRIPQYQL